VVVNNWVPNKAQSINCDFIFSIGCNFVLTTFFPLAIRQRLFVTKLTVGKIQKFFIFLDAFIALVVDGGVAGGNFPSVFIGRVSNSAWVIILYISLLK
jgi:hypothetical protein